MSNLSNKAQYTTAKDCWCARRIAEFLETALSRAIPVLAIYHNLLEVPYCYYKLVTNVTRAVKTYTHGIGSDIPWLSANQHLGLEPPSV